MSSEVPLRRGRLLPAADAPASGERSVEVARVGGAVVEEILGGQPVGPVDYAQGHDEWALVLEGSAVLEAMGGRLELSAGDWLLIPAGTPTGW